MPKNQQPRIIDIKRGSGTATGAAIAAGTGSGGTGGVVEANAGLGLYYSAGALNVGAGAGLTAAADSIAVGAGTLLTVAANTVGITAGANYQYIGTGSGTAAAWQNLSTLAGSGLAHTTGVLAVGEGNGLTVSANAVALTTPGALSVSSTNDASGSHTHAVTSSDNPGAAASLLATDASGFVTVVKAVGTNRMTTPLLDTGAASNLTLKPTENLYLDPDGNQVILPSSVAFQTNNYASQVTGWRITYDGQGDFRYLYTDELHAKKFIADLEQALAGGQIICKSVGMLGATFTAPAAGATTTLTMKDLPSAEDMAIFVSGDIVRLRNFSRADGELHITDCWGVVTNYADQADKLQTWTFTRSAVPNAGEMEKDETIAVDSIVLDYGTSGMGFHEVNAIDGLYGVNSPYSQIVTWTTHPAAAAPAGQVVRTRMGNLYGIFSVAGEYGLYAGTGVANTEQYLRISSNAVQLNNVPLNLRNSGTLTVQIQADGDARFGSNLAAVATTGLAIFSDAQTYNSEALGAGDLVIGNHSAANVLWDMSAGQLKFRDGTTTRAYVDTDGKIYWGTGEGLLDDDGIALTMTTNYGSGTGSNSKLSYYQTPSTRTDPIMSIYGGDGYGYVYDASIQPKNRIPGLVVKATGTTNYPTILVENSSGTQQPIWMTNAPWGELDTGDDDIKIYTRTVGARSSAGLSLTDDGGNLGIFVEDGGFVGIGNSAPDCRLHVTAAGTAAVRVESPGTTGPSIYLQSTDTNGAEWRLISHGSAALTGYLSIRDQTNTAYRMVFDTAGNVKIAGTADRGTTVGTNALHIFDGTAPAGTLTNGCSFYSTSGEMRVMDAAGNATLLSPHDQDGRWIFDSTDTITGRRLVIDAEKMFRALNDRFGWDFVHEFVEEV